MTALRDRALNLLTAMPEEQVGIAVHYLENIQIPFPEQTMDKTRARQAYENLKKYFGRIEREMNYEEELAEALREKYESLD